MEQHTHDRDFPNVSGAGRTWKVVGSRFGEMTREFLCRIARSCQRMRNVGRSWIWVDELVHGDSDILTDAHSPHEYSGYDLHVRKQPVLTTFATHDHLIIPDLDVEADGDQTVSIIVHTDMIWT
jgi:hypothetical protein